MNCLKEEIRKIFYNKMVIVFLLICTIFKYPVKPTLHITNAEVFGLFMAIMGLMGIGAGSMAFCLSSCSNHVIAMLMKVTPLTVIAGAYILSLENVFYKNNLLYGFLHISGIEMIPAIIIFVTEILCNIVRYKLLRTA